MILDVCFLKSCQQPTELFYLGFPVCEYHWRHHCDGTFNLKEAIGYGRTDSEAESGLRRDVGAAQQPLGQGDRA